MTLLSNYRTYIIAGLFGCLAAAHALGWVDDHTYETLQSALEGGGLAALRAGIKKAEAKAHEAVQKMEALTAPRG
jgi:hypothetical protein